MTFEELVERAWHVNGSGPGGCAEERRRIHRLFTIISVHVLLGDGEVLVPGFGRFVCSHRKAKRKTPGAKRAGRAHRVIALRPSKHQKMYGPEVERKKP